MNTVSDIPQFNNAYLTRAHTSLNYKNPLGTTHALHDQSACLAQLEHEPGVTQPDVEPVPYSTRSFDGHDLVRMQFFLVLAREPGYTHGTCKIVRIYI